MFAYKNRKNFAVNISAKWSAVHDSQDKGQFKINLESLITTLGDNKQSWNKAIDLNGDNSVDDREWEELYQIFGIFRSIDVNGDGNITREDFEKNPIYNKVIFKLCDDNINGLDFPEFIKYYTLFKTVEGYSNRSVN